MGYKNISEWRVTGTIKGKTQTIVVRAETHIDAATIASKAPHMLCVSSVMLIDKPNTEAGNGDTL